MNAVYQFSGPSGLYNAASNPNDWDTDDDTAYNPDGSVKYRSNDYDEFYGVRYDPATGTELERREDFRTDPGKQDTDQGLY